MYCATSGQIVTDIENIEHWNLNANWQKRLATGARVKMPQMKVMHITQDCVSFHLNE